MIFDYAKNILKVEIAKADYDGMSAQQAYDWLWLPYSESLARTVSIRLTALAMASETVLGPAKTDAAVGALKQQFPNIADALLNTGVDSTDAATQQFLAGLMTANILSSDDLARLAAMGTVTNLVQHHPRSMERFTPAIWPHVDEGGNVSSDEAQPSISGFPNLISFEDWSAVWAEVRT